MTHIAARSIARLTDASVSRGGDMIRDLISLIAPASLELFYDHFVRKVRFHVKSADPDRAVPLLPWSTINQLIEADTLSSKRFELYRAHNLIDPKMYRKGGSDGPIRAGIIQSLLRQGSSALMSGIDGLVPSIGRLTAAIERELSCRVWTNAYLSFGAGSAFKAHYDPHDVVILQVHGCKRWRSYGVPVLHPVELYAPIECEVGNVVWESLLEPGDVLYLPRGEVHEGDLEGDHSVHLTIGLQPCRGLDFVDGMIKQAAKEVRFRQDIPVVAGNPAIAEHEAAIKKALHALIDRTELNTYLDQDDRARRLRPVVNFGISGPFQPNVIVEPAVRRRIPLDIEIDAVVEVLIGGEKFRLSAPGRRVLDFLIWHGECSFGAIVSMLQSQLSEPLVQRAVQELAEQSLVGIGR